MDSSEKHVVAACSSVDVDRWWRCIQDLWLDWFAGCFSRVEPRRTAWSYVEGLMSLVGRKNCWWLAQHAGHDDPGRLQRLLDTARWDADVLRDALLRLVAALVAVAGRRWAIEECFQVTKDQFGLDHTQVRSWHGWHRHATLTMITFALTALAVRNDQPEPATTPHELAHPAGSIAVTINEARHLIAAIILASQPVGRALTDHLLG